MQRTHRRLLVTASLTALAATVALGLSGCATPDVAVGDTAPDFTLLDDGGTPVRLYDELATKDVVLFFYPADASPG